MKNNIIENVVQNSIAWEVGIKKGDKLLTVDGVEPYDILDYHYLISGEYTELEIEQSEGSILIVEIEKDYDEDLGLVFKSPLLSKMNLCKNNCVFCFMDQMPNNMRKSLYKKDDDYRLSFLHGNYITLTNVTKSDLSRIINYKLSPINISVHTTNHNLRQKILNNNNAPNILEQIELLANNYIDLNFQIVLLKGINDGIELINTIESLLPFTKKHAKSLSIVPVGLTKYRDNLPQLEPYTKKDARQVIELVKVYKDTNFVFLADEFYLKAELELPSYEDYGDFLQLENGVGMARLFIHQFEEAFKKPTLLKEPKTVSIVTGTLAYTFMQSIVLKLAKKHQIQIHLYPISNTFFGEQVTVSGLICASDIIKELAGKDLGTQVFIPNNMLKDDEDIFLDNISVTELSDILGVPVVPLAPDPQSFIKALIS